MRVVLGIDAAWTSHNPSGFALAVNDGAGWRLCAVAESYPAFHCLAHGEGWDGTSSLPSALVVLQTAAMLAGQPVDIVAVDMPLAMTPIAGRRASDNAVSRQYGSRYCGTHTPGIMRPGKISDDLRLGFYEAGYDLATLHVESPSLIEVYPHPALLELARADRRLPYKAEKTATYWKGDTPVRRRELLLQEWGKIITLLEGQIAGVSAAMPLPDVMSKSSVLKAYEDALDAIVCVWVGICALEGRAVPYGDSDSTIWIPNTAAN